MELGRQGSYLQCPSRSQSEALLIHKTKLMAHYDQETQQGADLPDLDSQTRSFIGPRGWFCPHPAKELSHSSTCCKVSSSHIWLEGLAETSWSCAAQQPSHQEVGRQSWLLPEQSQYWVWRVPLLCIGRVINSKPRLRVATSPSPLENLFGKLRIAWDGSSPIHSSKRAET